MLHILNGDSSSDILKQSEIAGEFLPWREALVAGPTPGNVTGEDWIELRAKHLSEGYGESLKYTRNELRKLHNGLASFKDHEEVTLWFEHDLFCQVNMIYILNWFSQRPTAGTRLSMICIGEYPGISDFRGLGQLDPSELAGLYTQRREITDSILRIANETWSAISSDDPTMVVACLDSDTRDLPFLREALLAHLARFPLLKDGLGQIERVLLQLIAGGIDEFGPIFHMFGDLEPVYGFGDAQIWNQLRMMASFRRPLIHISGIDLQKSAKKDDFVDALFVVTDLGERILSGEEKFNAERELDQWFGGYHFCGQNDRWFWSSTSKKLVKVI